MEKEYTCLMHPQILRQKSGSCPFCGMQLELTIGMAEDDTELQNLKRRFWVGFACTLPILFFAHFHYPPQPYGPWSQFIFAIPAVLWAGWPYLVKGSDSFVSRNMNLFTLISLGVGATFLYSLGVMLYRTFVTPTPFFHNVEKPLYFETVSVITVLVILGQLLELKARRKADWSIQQLLLRGNDTLPAPMIRFVSEAQRSRVSVQKLVDQVSSWFVPAVACIAILTFFIWGYVIPSAKLSLGIFHSAAVLIIACPRALGLAAPMSIRVGIGKGALSGILIKNGDALETMAKVDTVVIEQTGTISEPADEAIAPLRVVMATREETDKIIRQLQSEGHIVAMAGDAVKGTPANVVIALGTGTDSIPGNAGIALIQADLRGIARAKWLSEATLRNIKQNLWFAFLYNGLSIPIATGLFQPLFGFFVNPMVAGAAMSLSSLLVVINALRIKYIEI